MFKFMFSNKANARKEMAFIRNKLLERATHASIAMFEELAEKDQIIGEPIAVSISKKLYNATTKTFKSVDIVLEQYHKVMGILEKLHKKQAKRKQDMLNYLNNYITRLDAKEEKMVREKYCQGLDFGLLEDLFLYDYSDELAIDVNKVDDRPAEPVAIESPCVQGPQEPEISIQTEDSAKGEEETADEETEEQKDGQSASGAGGKTIDSPENIADILDS